MESQAPKKSDKVAYRIIDKEAVVVFLETQEVFVFNEVGSFIWELIDGKLNLEEIASRIASEFDVDIAEARKDLILFIQQLKEKNLILLE